MPRAKRQAPKKRRARGTGSIVPDKRRGGWLWKIPVGRYPNGRTRYTEVRGATQSECIENAKLVKPADPNTITVAEWAERWLATTGAGAPTRGDYRSTVELHVKPVLGDKPLNRVTTADVENMARAWKLGPNTARKNLAQVGVMFEAARRAKLIAENPARDAQGPKPRKVVIRPFTPQQLTRIIAEASERPDTRLFALLASVGCRIGEALALDVTDYADGVLSITKTWSAKYGTRRPKSENGVRTIRVPACARAAIEAGNGTRGPLFPAGGGYRPSYLTARRRWLDLLARLGLEHRGVHQLRHSVATHSIAAGVPIANVARDLGDSVTTILKTYCHSTDGATVADAMERLLAGNEAEDRQKK